MLKNLFAVDYTRDNNEFIFFFRRQIELRILIKIAKNNVKIVKM